MSGSITATAYNTTDKTWTITKDGTTFTVKDQNGDGKWDSNDTVINTDGELLSAEDLYEAKYAVKTSDLSVTDEDMAKMAEFRKLQEARDEAAAMQRDKEIQAKLAKYNASKPKKKSFIDKVMHWAGLTAQVGSAVGMIGMMFNSLNGCNDCNVKTYAGISAASVGLSALSQSFAGMGGYTTTSTPSFDMSNLFNTTALPGLSTNTATTAQAKLDAFLNAEKTAGAKAEQDEATETKTYKKAIDLLNEQLNTTVGDSNYADFMPKVNVTAIRGDSSTNEPGLWSKTSFTPEEKEQISNIKDYPFVPHTLLKSGKITKSEAEIINNQIASYIQHICSGKESCPTEFSDVSQELSNSSATYDSICKKIQALLKAMKEAQEVESEE